MDKQAGVSFRERGQRLTFVLSGSPTFKAYRLNITKVLDPSTANSVQLADVELLGLQVTGA